MAGRLGAWGLPRRVLALSGLVAVILIVPLAIAFLTGGVGAAVGLGVGYLASTQPALNLRWYQSLALSLTAAMTGGVAVALRGQPLAAAFFVALCCLLVAPANQLRDGLMAGVPTVASVLVAVPVTLDVARTFGWMLVGGVVLVLVAARLPSPPAPSAGVELLQNWRHAIVMALSVGVVVYVVLAFEVPHGYWIALTLTVVLRPFHDQTRRKALQRVAGTIGGVLLSLLLVAILPVWGVGVALALCLVMVIGFALTGDYTKQVVFLTPTVVLVGSADQVGVMVAERGMATIAGAGLAGLIGMSLAWIDARPGTPEEAV